MAWRGAGHRRAGWRRQLGRLEEHGASGLVTRDGPMGWWRLGCGEWEWEAERGICDGNPRVLAYIFVYGAHMSVVVVGLRVEGARVWFFQTRENLPAGFKYKPHPHPWAQTQTRILTLAGFSPRAHG